MSRFWKPLLLVFTTIFLLTACGQSLEERSAEGVKSASEAFYADDRTPTEEVDGTEFYKPIGFKVDEKSDGQNIVLNKGKDTFILFINPNEKSNSQLFYELLVADENKNVIAEDTFIEDNTFGFVAIVKTENDDAVELIVSVGGIKMTTRANEKKITANLPKMMEVVRSIK